jgi:hypothetical protein
VERANPGRVRLELEQSLAVDQLQPRDAVGRAAPVELLQAGKLVRRGRDHDLPAPPVRDPALVAIREQRGRPGRTESGLLRTRRVVEASMDDPARAPRLMERELGLGLEHDDARVGTTMQQCARRRQSEDAAADDGDVQP